MYNNRHSSNLCKTKLHNENNYVQESYALDLRPKGALWQCAQDSSSVATLDSNWYALQQVLVGEGIQCARSDAPAQLLIIRVSSLWNYARIFGENTEPVDYYTTVCGVNNGGSVGYEYTV